MSGGPVGKGGQLTAFDHIKFWVSNAKQTSEWYCLHYGFRPHAYKRENLIISHAVRAEKIILVFETYLKQIDEEFSNYVKWHGDAVKDVAFEVDDLDAFIEAAKMKGATVVREVWEEEDEKGTARYAVIQAQAHLTHTLIDRRRYTGLFLPGYKPPERQYSILDTLPPTELLCIDHAVTVHHVHEMEDAVEWYERTLRMHRFWSVDDTLTHTEYSGMRMTVVSNDQGNVKMPIVEPAVGSKRLKSQIQEYIDYNGGSGVQHIAFATNDIVSSIQSLVNRGAEFIRPPKTYYGQLRQRLKLAPIKVEEDLDELERLNILLDYDENGYMLQIFTKPVQDRPTLFLEIIQRHNHEGFGAGNIKALFEAVEMEQRLRENLHESRSDGHA